MHSKRDKKSGTIDRQGITHGDILSKFGVSAGRNSQVQDIGDAHERRLLAAAARHRSWYLAPTSCPFDDVIGDVTGGSGSGLTRDKSHVVVVVVEVVSDVGC